MSDPIKKSLLDILMAIEGNDIHLDHKRDFQLYSQRPTSRRATERELEIIGEAVNRILKADKDFPLSRARQIISFRNHVIHSYDSVDNNLVWKIIIQDIPVLRQEVIDLLKD
jgi:uncharacterized protein with HEPN domain